MKVKYEMKKSRIYIYLMLTMPLIVSAQFGVKHHEALKKIQINEGYFGYEMHYPNSVGDLILGAKVTQTTSDSSRLIRCTYTMGNKFINLELSANIKYRLTLGYDVFRDTYVVTSLDNSVGLIDVYQGDFDNEGNLVVSNVVSGTHYKDNEGKKHFNRLSFRQMNFESFTVVIEDSDDNGQTWKLQSEYKVGVQ